LSTCFVDSDAVPARPGIRGSTEAQIGRAVDALAGIIDDVVRGGPARASKMKDEGTVSERSRASRDRSEPAQRRAGRRV
jgi:hypothetical protein